MTTGSENSSPTFVGPFSCKAALSVLPTQLRTYSRNIEGGETASLKQIVCTALTDCTCSPLAGAHDNLQYLNMLKIDDPIYLKGTGGIRLPESWRQQNEHAQTRGRQLSNMCF